MSDDEYKELEGAQAPTDLLDLVRTAEESATLPLVTRPPEEEVVDSAEVDMLPSSRTGAGAPPVDQGVRGGPGEVAPTGQVPPPVAILIMLLLAIGALVAVTR